MEKALARSQGSVRILAGSLLGTAVIFAGLSLSKLGKIQKVEEPESRSIAMFVPPPPPPERTEVITETPPPENFDLDISFEESQTVLSFQKIDADIMSTLNIEDSVDIDISSFLKQGISKNVDSKVYTRAQLDERPSGWQFNLPTIPSKLSTKYPVMVFRILCLIDERGKPIRAHVMESPDPVLNPIIEEAITRSRYSTPGKKNGRRVRCWVQRKLTIRTGSNRSPFSL